MSILNEYRSSALLAFVALVGMSAFGQAPAPGQGLERFRRPVDTLVSPEVHPDHTVTFRLRAPQAKEVTLTGDWMATPESTTGGTTKMTRDTSGVWSFTSPPLEPTIHLYYFTVDGMNIADPVNPDVKLRTRTSASLVEVPGDPVPVWQLQDVPHGSVDLNWQRSNAYHDYHQFAVYLPAGYYNSTARYPVLYLVHGGGDVATSWMHPGNANVILDNLIAQKKAVPMIVVLPFDGSNNPQGQRGRAGAPAAPLARGPSAAAYVTFDAYLTKELIPLVDATYRTLPDRKHRAMAGLSMGGGATFYVGLKHTELFSEFGIFSAGARSGQFKTSYPELADAKTAAAKLDLVWLAAGEQDMALAGSKSLDKDLTALKINHSFHTRPGGHVWPVWRWALSEFTPLLFRNH